MSHGVQSSVVDLEEENRGASGMGVLEGWLLSQGERQL